MAAKGMEKWLEKFNADEKNTKQPYFIHKTLRYSYKDEEKQQGVKKTLEHLSADLSSCKVRWMTYKNFLQIIFPNFI